MGTARTIRSYNNLLHIVQLEVYKTNIDKISNSLLTFGKINELNDSVTITNIKLTELKTKLHTLMPKSRNRRGLIDGLGTVIKSITGNMDASDALRLNKEIEQLMQNQINVRNQVNQQNQINSQMIQRFGNITDHINNQQEIIKNYLNYTQSQLDNRITSDEITLKYSQYLNQINYNIDLLNSHLTNIAEAIMMARLNIISKQILSPEELSDIYDFFQNRSIEIKSDENIYELLGLQAYYNNTNIVFNIQIPVILEDSYSFFHIIPLPINKTQKIVAKPYAILNHKNIQYFDDKCPQIEGIFYCQESKNQEHIFNATCIPNLMNNKPAECRIEEQSGNSEVIQLDNNYIVLINIPEIAIKSTCEPSELQIKGTLIIHFQNCQIEINQMIYESSSHVYWDDIHIYPLSLSPINTTTTPGVLNLQKLQKYQFKNKELIEILQTRNIQTNSLTISIFTVLCLSVIGIGYFLTKTIRTTTKSGAVELTSSESAATITFNDPPTENINTTAVRAPINTIIAPPRMQLPCPSLKT